MIKRLAVIVCSVFLVYILGCASNPAGVSETSTAVPQANTSLANLNIVLSPSTLASLRAATTESRYYIKILLFLANPGSATSPFTKLQKIVYITGTTAQATFVSVPAKPALVQIILNDSSVSGSKSFHGAIDLAEGNNTIIPVAVGSANASDTAANVFEKFITSPTLMQNAPATLVKTISAKISLVGNDALAALNAIAKDILTSGYTDIASATSGTSLQVGTNTILNTTYWNDATTKLNVSEILRPGIGDFGYVYWESTDKAKSAISKVLTSNGSNSASCINSGSLSNFIVQSDNTIIAAGYNSVKNCPVIFKWTPGTTQGNVDTGTGLNWVYYFSDFTGFTGTTAVPAPSIEKIFIDTDGSLLINVRKASTNTLIEFRIDSSTGEFPGIADITNAYSAMQTILQNNSLTEQQRVTTFMTYIGDDFKDIAGTPDQKSNLESVTLDRLQRYVINSYTFTKSTVEIVNSTTIKVTTPMFIDVTRKPGAAGAISAATVVVSPVPVITWKRYLSGWKIYQGFPYKSSEISI